MVGSTCVGEIAARDRHRVGPVAAADVVPGARLLLERVPGGRAPPQVEVVVALLRCARGVDTLALQRDVDLQRGRLRLGDRDVLGPRLASWSGSAPAGSRSSSVSFGLQVVSTPCRARITSPPASRTPVARVPWTMISSTRAFGADAAAVVLEAAAQRLRQRRGAADRHRVGHALDDAEVDQRDRPRSCRPPSAGRRPSPPARPWAARTRTARRGTRCATRS